VNFIKMASKMYKIPDGATTFKVYKNA